MDREIKNMKKKEGTNYCQWTDWERTEKRNRDLQKIKKLTLNALG